MPAYARLHHRLVSRIWSHIRPRAVLPALAGILALAPLVTACDNSSGSATPADATTPGEGGPPPALVGTTNTGEAFDLSQLKGQVVVVDFWASWCEPCKDELPELEQIYAEYKEQGLVIVGVNLDESAEDMNVFLKANKLSFPVVFDEGRSIVGNWDPPKMPTSFFIARDGTLAHRHAGFERGDVEKIRATIAELLAAGTSP